MIDLVISAIAHQIQARAAVKRLSAVASVTTTWSSPNAADTDELLSTSLLSQGAR